MAVMKTCPFCLADIPAEARKCMHCGEWVNGSRKAVSSYNFGEKAFLTGLLSFCIPPMALIAIVLGLAALIRNNPGDSPGWAIAGIILGTVAILVWMVYVATIIVLRSG
jgi:hypothetical protein